MVLDKMVILQTILQHDIGHSIQQGQIHRGLEQNLIIGNRHALGLTYIGHDDFHSGVFTLVLNEAGVKHGMCLRHIGANHK